MQALGLPLMWFGKARYTAKVTKSLFKDCWRFTCVDLVALSNLASLIYALILMRVVKSYTV